MRPIQFLGPAVLLAGVLALALAVARGDASLYLILVIPAVVGTGPLAFLGILLVFIGFFLTSFLWSAGTPMPSAPAAEIPGQTPREVLPRRRWGGVVFLGPLPIVFGSDPQMTRTMLVLGAILFLALLILTVVILFG